MANWRLVLPVALAAVAGFQAQAGIPATTAPFWTGPRSAAEFYPDRAQRLGVAGAAVISCTVAAGGALTDCSIKTESPAGFEFGAQALKMSAYMRMPANGTKPGPIDIPINFTLPAPPDSSHWIRGPSGNDLAAVYPARAIRLGLSGRAVLGCRITEEGDLRGCTVESEAPEDYGFGAAALKLAAKFRMSSTTISGKSVEGSVIHIPILFRVPGGPPPPPLPAPLPTPD